MMRFLVGAALLVGCYKNTAAPTPPAAQKSPVVASQPVRDYRAALADPVGFLPVDSELVLAIDGDEVRKSPLWTMAEQRIRMMAGAKFTTFTASCGFDPLATIRGVTIGLRALKNDQPRGVVVITGVSRDKLTECFDRTVKTSAEITRDSDVFVLRSTASDPTGLAVTFVDEATAVMLIAPTADRAALTKVLASGAPLRRSPTFTQLLAQVDTASAVWGIANGKSSIFDIAQGNQKPSAIWGSIRLDSGASVAVRIRFNDVAVAQQLATQAQTQLTGAQMFFDRLDVNADGSELVVEAVMSETKLASLMSLMGLAQQAQAPATAPPLGP
jgi:hypothetical protein